MWSSSFASLGEVKPKRDPLAAALFSELDGSGKLWSSDQTPGILRRVMSLLDAVPAEGWSSEEEEEPAKHAAFQQDLRAHEAQWDLDAAGSHLWSTPRTPFFWWQVKGFVCGLLYLLCAGIVQTISLEFTSRLLAEGPPLPDLVHENVPKLVPEKVSDIFCLFMAVFMFSMALLIKHNFWRAGMHICFCWGSLFMLRSVTIFVTSLRLTDNHCRSEPHPQLAGGADIDNALKSILSIGMKSVHCGDLLFSGHAMFLTMVTMVCFTYAKRPMLATAAALYSAAGYAAIVATRNHYSVDVVVAIYVAVCTFKLVPNCCSWIPLPPPPASMASVTSIEVVESEPDSPAHVRSPCRPEATMRIMADLPLPSSREWIV
eukprot:NODE_314_length_1640_cov_161.771842_g235_i0.p1 GENE.NODE_314_length_1640_cov_161.771842_g235_i0~~NODE_314_length_1640_cov_161.771842_g235_i0.p1  ORF type:complete len:373 (+),score=37.09 NODE_314_length_1640_cov_161.771842_g235_i0:87-1205(+)